MVEVGNVFVQFGKFEEISIVYKLFESFLNLSKNLPFNYSKIMSKALVNISILFSYTTLKFLQYPSTFLNINVLLSNGREFDFKFVISLLKLE